MTFLVSSPTQHLPEYFEFPKQLKSAYDNVCDTGVREDFNELIALIMFI